MNKSLIYTAIISAATIIIAPSCNKILDLEPHNSTFTDAYFTSEADANTALSGAYAIMRKNMLDNSTWHKYGDIVSGGIDIDGGLDNGNYNITHGEYVGLNVGSGNWNWQKYYQLLQQINLIINKVPQIPDAKFKAIATKNHIVGEAYFLRAYTYFFMSRIWGDVPLTIEPDLNADEAKQLPRTSADTVLAQCLRDVATAEGLLDFGYANEGERAVRANKGSAYALEAHIKAWKKDYAGAEVAANEVITKGGYLLLDSAHYNEVFIGKSMEGIFEINFDAGQDEGIALRNTDGSFNDLAKSMSFPIIPTKGNLEWRASTYFVNNIFAADSATDIRYKSFFFQPQSDRPQIVKFANISFADGSAKTDPRMSNNIILMRLADIMLLRAEALNALGRDGEAITLLNQVRQRAHVPDYSGTDLRIGILEERLKELYYEGQSYYDLVRTGELPTYNEFFPATQFARGGWMWPIDPDMFKDNYFLKQTPYWQGKL